MAAGPHKRRTFLIDRGFQLKYTGILMAVGATITVLFGTMMYQAHVEATEMLPAPVREALGRSSDQRLLLMVAAIAVVMTLALALFGVLITHRVAGPLFIMSRHVRSLGAGHYPQFRPLRRNDELKEFFATFQEAVEQMRTRHASDLAAVETALEQLERYCVASPEAEKALNAALVSLKAVRDRQRQALQPAAPEAAPSTSAAA